MEKDRKDGISIKDYAEDRGKTIQAVYQQMKRKENATALEGHVFTRRVGNKDVKFLDDEAVRILDEASRSTQTVIYKEFLKDELEQATQDLELAQKNLIFQEGQLKALRDTLAETEKKLLALAAPEAQIEALEAQISDLKGDKEELKGKVAEADNRAVKANREAFNAKLYAKELEAYLKLPKIVQLFTKKPVLRNLEEGTTEEVKE